MIILSTKELSKKQIALLDEKKFALIHTSFIKIKSIKFSIDKVNDFLIFTSKNAIRSVLKNRKINELKGKTCICVGEKTKLFLEKNGFSVLAFSKDANALAELILQKYSDHSFTFFSGTIRKDILPEKLSENNIPFDEITVYKTILQPKKNVLETEAILFFSPSAVTSYLQINEIGNQTCFCIGNTTAKALENSSNISTLNIKIASQPTVESVIEAVITHYNK